LLGITGGIFQLRSRVEVGVPFGQYIRSIRMNRSAGAGSQLASRSLPGDSCCTSMSSEPSALCFSALRGLTVDLFSGFATKNYSASYMVSDQKPLTGGVSPLAKCITYLLAPL